MVLFIFSLTYRSLFSFYYPRHYIPRPNVIIVLLMLVLSFVALLSLLSPLLFSFIYFVYRSSLCSSLLLLSFIVFSLPFIAHFIRSSLLFFFYLSIYRSSLISFALLYLCYFIVTFRSLVPRSFYFYSFVALLSLLSPLLLSLVTMFLAFSYYCYLYVSRSSLFYRSSLAFLFIARHYVPRFS